VLLSISDFVQFCKFATFRY